MMTIYTSKFCAGQKIKYMYSKYQSFTGNPNQDECRENGQLGHLLEHYIKYPSIAEVLHLGSVATQDVGTGRPANPSWGNLSEMA